MYDEYVSTLFLFLFRFSPPSGLALVAFLADDFAGAWYDGRRGGGERREGEGAGRAEVSSRRTARGKRKQVG